MYKIPANTLFMGKNMVFVPECHSTNTLALEMSQHGAIIDGSVIITDRQMAGRGQRGNSWETEPGKNLTFSVILKPHFLSLRNQFFLSIFASLSILDLLKERIDALIQIKWPNDILLKGKKLCGILIENQLQGMQVSNAIIGIGLNVNQQHFSTDKATSLNNEMKMELNNSEILETLLWFLEKRYMQLREGRLEDLKSEYLDQLYWLHEDHVFNSKGQSFRGKIIGIDEVGKLMLETPIGEQSFDVKEIQYIH